MLSNLATSSQVISATKKLYFELYFSSVQKLNRVLLFVTTWTAAHQASLSITNSWSLLKFISIKSVMPSNHLILCCPILLPSNFSSIMVFSNEYQEWFPLGLTGWISTVQGTQESSPIPQLKSLNSWVLSFLYSPTLTSTHS